MRTKTLVSTVDTEGRVRRRKGAAKAPKPAEATLTLMLPLPPNMANGRMHWRVKNQRRKEYLSLCDQMQAVGVIDAPPAQPFGPCFIEAEITMPRAMDDDNAMARLEWPIDWLASRGYLAGDSRKHLTWRGLPEQRVSRRDVAHIQFIITRAPQAPEGRAYD